MRGVSGLIIFCALGAWVGPAAAGPNADAKIACHLVPHVAKGNSCQSPPMPPCNSGQENFVIHGALRTSYDLYLFVADGDSSAGISGAEFGIDYLEAPQQGVDVLAWTMCADAAFGSYTGGPAWPDAGSGNVIFWDQSTNCQKTPAVGDLNAAVTAVLGSLYVYAFSDDVFRITKRPGVALSSLSVVGCGLSTVRDTLDFPRSAGKVSFGQSGLGFDPCR